MLRWFEGEKEIGIREEREGNKRDEIYFVYVYETRRALV